MSSPASIFYLYKKELETEDKRYLPIGDHATDKQVSSGATGWRTALFLSGLLEVMGYLSIQLTLFLYCNNELQVPVATAANLTTNFLGTLVITPLISHLVADTFAWQFGTTVFLSVLQVLGLALLVALSSISPGVPASCYRWTTVSWIPLRFCKPSHAAVCAILLCVVAAGTGGLKAATAEMRSGKQRLNLHEIKILLRLLPIWAATFFSSAVLAQLTTFMLWQSKHMRSPGILGDSLRLPAASTVAFALLIGPTLALLRDRLTPGLKRTTIESRPLFAAKTTPLQRIGVGLFLSASAMVAAGLVEQRRRASESTLLANSLDLHPVSAMSVAWLLPQALGAGLGDYYTVVGVLELYYQDAPRPSPSTAGVLSMSSQCAGYFLSSLIVSILYSASRHAVLHEGERVDVFYFLLATIGAVNFILFVSFATWYASPRKLGRLILCW